VLLIVVLLALVVALVVVVFENSVVFKVESVHPFGPHEDVVDDRELNVEDWQLDDVTVCARR
jgi:hypothetical protein